MNIIIRLCRYSFRHSAALIAAFSIALVGAGLELAKPWPGKLVIDYGLTSKPLPAFLAGFIQGLPGGTTRQGLIAWSVGAAILIAWASAAISFQVLSLVVRVCQRMVYTLSMELFEKVQRLSIAFHGRHAVGDLLQRFSGDVFIIHIAVSQVALPGSISLLTLIGMFFVMAKMDLSLALIAVCVVPFLAAALAGFAKPMDRTTTRQWEVHGSVMALMEQSLSAIRAIQGFGREDFMQRKVAQRADELMDAYAITTVVSSGYQQVTSLITGTAAAILLWFGSMRVVSGRMSIGDLWVFLAYLAALYGPVNMLSNAVGYAVQVISRGRRIFEVMDAQEEVLEDEHPLSMGRARGEIVFRNVSFGYGTPGEADAGRPTLESVSFRAAPGMITAIVGPSGAGKTTLVSLISRFYDPWEGQVLLDGHDLRRLKLKSVRENISLVLQEPFLFAMSVSDNIAFGKPGATSDEIQAAARAARAHDFILKLPQGYETVIGEKGASLSGGERQRLSIARALIKDAPILILDEPTSSLDAHTESLIFDALTEVMRSKTVFIISHRLSTIRRADQILALADGRIVERGTHDVLLAKGDLYAQLYRHQDIYAQ